MALNEVFKDADSISLPVPDGTLSGTPLRIGILNAVAQTDVGGTVNAQNVINGVAQPTGGIGNADGFASIKTSGAWRVPVTTAATLGQAIYITSAGVLTATATGNFLWGVALRAKGTGTADLLVRIINGGQTVASA